MKPLKKKWELNDEAGTILYFTYCQQIPQKTKTNNELNLLPDIVCVSKASYILLLCATERHCCPKTNKTRQWATLSNWVTCSFITMNMGTDVLSPFHPHVLLLGMLSSAPNMYSFMAENSPQKKHYLLRWLKTTVLRCFMELFTLFKKWNNIAYLWSFFFFKLMS